jgi:hypothetical protein
VLNAGQVFQKSTWSVMKKPWFLRKDRI